MEKLTILPQSFLDFIKPIKNQKSALVSSKGRTRIPKEEAKRMLSFIPTRPGYDIWCSIAWGIGNSYPPDVAKELIMQWSPDDSNGEKVDRLLAENNGSITIGSVIRHAKQEGYVLPTLYKKCIRTPGQVALEDIFNKGEGFIAVNSVLYNYSNEYYQSKTDDFYENQITQYFNEYVTDFDTGFKGLATSKKVTEALDYVKKIVYKAPEELNPRGINLKNGFLELNYINNEPDFILKDHDSRRFCTYKADFNYDPSAKNEIFDKAVNDMLNFEDQDMIFKTISITLDLPEIRKRHGHTIQAAMLHGKGANGKDTLRKWTTELYGNKGVSHLSLNEINHPDRSYIHLQELVDKKINWSPEDESSNLDRCDNLKKCITGEPITYKPLYSNPKTLIPNSIFIFNSNELFRVTKVSDAFTRRFKTIDFPNRFTSCPDPNKPHEKLADSRLKEDDEFIRENILPAYLNKLIHEFKEVYLNGVPINQSSRQKIEEIAMENNHLFEYIADREIVECPQSEGIRSSDLHSDYLSWCWNKGYYDGNQFHDPDSGDKIVRSAGQIYKRLKTVLPDIKNARTRTGTVLGVKINSQGEILSLN